MTMPASTPFGAASLQSKVDDLERRLAVLEQYIQACSDGGVMIRTASGGVHIIAATNVEIGGTMGVSLNGDRGVGIVSSGNINLSTFGAVSLTASAKIVMNKAPTIQS
jgi:hypothetical protein